MGAPRRRIAADLAGVHLALNVFVATCLLWIVIRKWAGLNPIWAISAMLASSNPHVSQAIKSVRGRVINALLGCATGLAFLMLGGALGASRDWKLPLALAATALLSSYIVRVPVMWRQAPITAAIIVASGIEHHSQEVWIEIGLRRVGEVLFGCLLGLAVSWLISKIWPLPQSPADRARSALTLNSPARCYDDGHDVDAALVEVVALAAGRPVGVHGRLRAAARRPGRPRRRRSRAIPT